MVGLCRREPTMRVGIPVWTGLCRDPSGDYMTEMSATEAADSRLSWGWIISVP
jgi:hypothetical protein